VGVLFFYLTENKLRLHHKDQLLMLYRKILAPPYSVNHSQRVVAVHSVLVSQLKVPAFNNYIPNGPMPVLYRHTICRIKVPLTSPSLKILSVRDAACYIPTATGDLRLA
jgi:hypothetical protein